jgi:hypothetical protein
MLVPGAGAPLRRDTQTLPIGATKAGPWGGRVRRGAGWAAFAFLLPIINGDQWPGGFESTGFVEEDIAALRQELAAQLSVVK